MHDKLRHLLKKSPFVAMLYQQAVRMRDGSRARVIFKAPELLFAAMEKKGDGIVVLETTSGLRIAIRQNLWDARIVKEMYLDRPYLRGIQLPKDPVIVDIGGYIGDFSLYAAHYLSASKVVVYEPTHENYSILLRNISLNGMSDRIIAVEKAVSGASSVELNVVIEEAQEIHASAYWHSKGEKRTVPSVTLTQLLADHGLASVDLLKIDCEGGEYDILPSASKNTLACFRTIAFEHHRVEGWEQKLRATVQRLREAGFAVRTRREIGYAVRE